MTRRIKDSEKKLSSIQFSIGQRGGKTAEMHTNQYANWHDINSKCKKQIKFLGIVIYVRNGNFYLASRKD